MSRRKSGIGSPDGPPVPVSPSTGRRQKRKKRDSRRSKDAAASSIPHTPHSSLSHIAPTDLAQPTQHQQVPHPPQTAHQSAATLSPVLKAVVHGEEVTSGDRQPLEGPCGNFRRVRTWVVENAVAGIIVQRVTREFEVFKCEAESTKMSNEELNNYVNDGNSSLHADAEEYWELWIVDADGTVGRVQDGADDTFGLCAVIPAGQDRRKKLSTRANNTTKGTFTIHGEAWFYPTDQGPEYFGFSRDVRHGGVPVAGGLFSRTASPDGVLSKLPPANCIQYSVTVTWDSSAGAADKYGVLAGVYSVVN